jgi:tetratricopeptide (TPR) repeat protein
MSSRHDAARWQAVQQVLDDLLARPGDEHAAMIADLRTRDRELADEVQELLRQHGGDVLPEALPVDCLDLDSTAEPDLIGARFGPFVIDARVGSGGTGVVYRAHRDGDFAQTVAIKRLAHARLGSSAARRLGHERDMLAQLDHPGIVRLVDTGISSDGTPFLALEFVDGETWDHYLANHEPDVGTRLRLFAELCDAVSYAHQRLLVHRDIKPGNLMVTREGVPKLLDYGIAKLLEGDQTSTLTRDFGSSLTPAYAAPEQLLGEVVTTATDVHALGLLLYETLARAHPFRRPQQSAEALQRALREQPPPSLSTQPHLVAMPTAWQQDLERVLAKALDKEAQHRYAAASDLAEDVRAVIDGRPVRARHATRAYILRRFIGRHRVAVAAGVVAGLLLLATTSWALLQSRIAASERIRAERRFDDVHHFASTVLFDYHERIRKLSGSMAVQQSIVADAVRYLESLHAEAGDDPRLLADIARAYLRVGDIQGSSYGPNVGDFDGAARSYERAGTLLGRLDALGVRTPEITLVQANLLSRRADVAHQASQLEVARGLFAQAIECFRQLPAGMQQQIDVVVEFANVLDHYGDLLGREGGGSLNEVGAARAQHAQARRLREAALQEAPDDTALRFGRYQSELRDGEYWLGQNRMAQAEAAFTQALATLAALVEAAPDDVFYRYEQALVQSRLIPVRDALGQLDASIEIALQALATTESLLKRDPEHDTLQQAVAASCGWAAKQLLKAGRANEAIPIVRRQREIATHRLDAAPDNPEGVSALSVAVRREGDIAEALGDFSTAIERHREALALQDRHAHLSPDFMQTRTLSLMHIGRNQTRRGEIAAARATLTRASADFQQLADTNPEAVRYRDDLAEVHALAAEAWLAAPRDLVRAQAEADAANALWTAAEQQDRLGAPTHTRREALNRLLTRSRANVQR